eukprot:5340428-Heterocapsa_arctica.AAC.1
MRSVSLILREPLASCEGTHLIGIAAEMFFLAAASHLSQRSARLPVTEALPPLWIRLASFTTPRQSATMLKFPAKCSATYTIACNSALYAVWTFPGRADATFA